jgi:hypothetical protein
MALTRWNPFNETLFLEHEMDPIFEDKLAQILNEPAEDQKPEEFPIQRMVDQKALVFLTVSGASP